VKVNHLKSGNTKSCGCARARNGAEVKKQDMIRKFGAYISSEDDWYQRSAGIWGRTQTLNIKTDFLGIPDLAFHLKSIAPVKCPVFGKKLRTGNKEPHAFSPSVDRIVPSKGYSRGNMQVVSNLANTMKQGANPTQLNRFAIWSLSGEPLDMSDKEANDLAEHLKKEIQRYKLKKKGR
jgi:hypothetical protein